MVPVIDDATSISFGMEGQQLIGYRASVRSLYQKRKWSHQTSHCRHLR